MAMSTVRIRKNKAAREVRAYKEIVRFVDDAIAESRPRRTLAPIQIGSAVLLGILGAWIVLGLVYGLGRAVAGAFG